MSETVNVLTPQSDAWQVQWGPSGSGFDFGLLNDVDPSKLEMVLQEIKRGSTGETVLGHLVMGLKGTIDVMCPDLNVAAFLAVSPWMTASTNQILAPSGNNVDLYTYAQLLNLHPVAAGNTLTGDLNFVKTTPRSLINYKRDGMKQPVWKISFEIYIDRAQLPKRVWAWLGSATPSDE